MVCTSRNTQCMPRAASMNCRVGCIPPPSLLRLTNRFPMTAAAAVNAMSIKGMTLVVNLSSYEMWEPPCCLNEAITWATLEVRRERRLVSKMLQLINAPT